MLIEKAYGNGDLNALFDDLFRFTSEPHPLAFRGQAKACWSLIPSIERKALNVSYAERLQEEMWVVVEFRKKAMRFMDKLEQIYLGNARISFSVLSILQHYGAPTRILDWTYSPFFALYFAAIGEPSHDGAIFWFNREVFDKNGPDWEGLGVGKRPDGQRDIDAHAFEEHSRDWLCCNDHLVPFGRMEKQHGFFSITGRLCTNHEVEIERMIPGQVHKLIISAKLKEPVLDRLERMGVKSKGIDYPGADHVGRDIADQIKRKRGGQ
jgi:hypothetical protein